MERYNGSRSAKAYQVVNDLLNHTNRTEMVWGNEIRPVRTSGKGRFTRILDYTNDIANLLSLIGVKYELKNDAPRGGKMGNYIKIKTRISHEPS